MKSGPVPSCRRLNLQQLPRREGSVSASLRVEGYVYVAADYHVAELCSLARSVSTSRVGYSRLGDAIPTLAWTPTSTRLPIFSVSRMGRR